MKRTMIKLSTGCVSLLCLLAVAGSAAWAGVTVEKQADGWHLLVDGKPYVIQGVCYVPSKVGESPENNTMRDWMEIDDDFNGRNDAAYDAWVDKNRNNQQDENEPAVGDFQLMKDMGVNTIRLYHHASADPEVQKNTQSVPYHHAPNKALLRDLFETYGIRVMMGDFLGAYTVGSGAAWDKGTDYTDPVQKAAMLKSVEDMVREFKDEPFLLMWALGNENNLGQFTRTNAGTQSEAYAKFVNEVARRIHELDPAHPVVLVNGETLQLDVYAQYAPDVDIIGINSYRNIPGFGNLFEEVAARYGKPVLLSEYGTQHPVIAEKVLDEIKQMDVHMAAWRDIQRHTAGGETGNCIGGFASEWLDTWWKSWSPWSQDLSEDQWHPEWHGITSQGNGQRSLFLRQLRHVYFAYQKVWAQGQSAE